jgi:uncharacterized membrane-anchored protein
MNIQLTQIEKQQLETFLSSTEKATESSWYFISSSLLMLTGAFLFAYTTFLTLKQLTDKIVFRVFFPGAAGAIFLILIGIFLLRQSQKISERKGIAKIVKKLIENE